MITIKTKIMIITSPQMIRIAIKTVMEIMITTVVINLDLIFSYIGPFRINHLISIEHLD